jgi:hypothetical protein
MKKILNGDKHIFEKYGNKANVKIVEGKILLTLR